MAFKAEGEKMPNPKWVQESIAERMEKHPIRTTYECVSAAFSMGIYKKGIKLILYGIIIIPIHLLIKLLTGDITRVFLLSFTAPAKYFGLKCVIPIEILIVIIGFTNKEGWNLLSILGWIVVFTVIPPLLLWIIFLWAKIENNMKQY